MQRSIKVPPISASHRDYSRKLDKNYYINIFIYFICMLFTFSEHKEVPCTCKTDSKKKVSFAFLPLIKEWGDPSIYSIFHSHFLKGEVVHYTSSKGNKYWLLTCSSISTSLLRGWILLYLSLCLCFQSDIWALWRQVWVTNVTGTFVLAKWMYKNICV